MNDPDPLPSPEHPADVLWACVEDGFHVGSRGGDFLGYVDRQPNGTYRAFDARSNPIGDHPSLAEATTAVTATTAGSVSLLDAGDTMVGGDR